MSENDKTENKEMSINEFKEFIHTLDLSDVLIKCQILDEVDIRGDKISCLFHEEDTPSMQLNEDYAYCYGCGWSGDAIAVVRGVYDFSFMQAISYIADYYNITINGSSNPFLASSNDRISYNKLEEEWEGYKRAAKRRMKEDPSSKEQFKSYFPLEVGWDEKLKYFVFRYTSKTGKTLGFTKRRGFEISDEDKARFPKWKHSSSSDSRISECQNIFNLGQAIKNIRNTKSVILVEGPKDTIPFLSKNMKNVVAVSGTSNTNKIFEILPDVEEVILAFDGDDAGKKGEREITYHLSSTLPLDKITWIDFGDMDPYDYFFSNRKKIPKPKPIIGIFNDKELCSLYEYSNPFNKEELIKSLALERSISYSEAKSFFDMQKTKINKSKKDSEKERLVKSNDEESLRKLALKFDID